ncbi:hypothetical protein J2X31_003342 [Flavobacterium arsenatis]|uniref:DUF1543 domain-containing protein n=1 Tax=Flavobacterium arsenatis TaxID=1484332 RepID=A0ABU1TTU9_9FLAO|nr:DUF1543 domain-containing protein [Flavobacterium arsenatis]MDR6969312.1 hypothetical protein [Flavobacterium arsenatis]
MENKLKLYMVMLGCTPDGRLTEQHDIFFGIGTSLKDLLPDMIAFWPEAKGQIHIDAWREVTSTDGFSIEVVERNAKTNSNQHLFFLNLGGYKKNEFEEYHYKVLTVAPLLSTAIKASKETAFYKHFGFKGAASHVDDKYGIDVDDVFKVEDILGTHLKERYQLKITENTFQKEDKLHIGYVALSKLI